MGHEDMYGPFKHSNDHDKEPINNLTVQQSHNLKAVCVTQTVTINNILRRQLILNIGL